MDTSTESFSLIGPERDSRWDLVYWEMPGIGAPFPRDSSSRSTVSLIVIFLCLETFTTEGGKQAGIKLQLEVMTVITGTRMGCSRRQGTYPSGHRDKDKQRHGATAQSANCSWFKVAAAPSERKEWVEGTGRDGADGH